MVYEKKNTAKMQSGRKFRLLFCLTEAEIMV